MTCLPLADREPGTYDLEPLRPGWSNAEVTFAHRNGKVESRYEILDLRDGKGTRYQQEPIKITAVKCLGLFIAGLPAYFLAYTFIHLIRLPLVPLVNLSPTAFFKQIWKIASIPFYFVALEWAALYGVFRPLEGRALFAHFEKSLHGGKSRGQAIQNEKKDPPIADLLREAFFEKENRRALFAGFCMQPLGQIDDPHVKKVQYLKKIPAA